MEDNTRHAAASAGSPYSAILLLGLLGIGYTIIYHNCVKHEILNDRVIFSTFINSTNVKVQ